MSAGSAPDVRVSEWVSYTRVPSVSLAEKCLKMSQMLETPDLDIAKYMDVMRDDLLRHGYDPGIMRRAGYRVADGRPTIKTTLLDRVVDTRLGSALSLAVIHQQMAALGNVPAFVMADMTAPLVRGERFCVDAMGDAVPSHIRGRISDENVLYETHILAGMLSALKSEYIRTARYDEAMMCIDMAAGVGVGTPADHRDIGLIMYRTGDKKAAWWLKKYLRETPDADDSVVVSSLVDFLDND